MQPVRWTIPRVHRVFFFTHEKTFEPFSAPGVNLLSNRGREKHRPLTGLSRIWNRLAEMVLEKLGRLKAYHTTFTSGKHGAICQSVLFPWRSNGATVGYGQIVRWSTPGGHHTCGVRSIGDWLDDLGMCIYHLFRADLVDPEPCRFASWIPSVCAQETAVKRASRGRPRPAKLGGTSS